MVLLFANEKAHKEITTNFVRLIRGLGVATSLLKSPDRSLDFAFVQLNATIQCFGGILFVPANILNVHVSINAAQDIFQCHLRLVEIVYTQSLDEMGSEMRDMWRMMIHLLPIFKPRSNFTGFAVSVPIHSLLMDTHRNTRTRVVDVEEYINPGEDMTSEMLLERCPKMPIGFSLFNLGDHQTDHCHNRVLELTKTIKSVQWGVFVLGTHKRLGRCSPITMLCEDVLYLIVASL